MTLNEGKYHLLVCGHKDECSSNVRNTRLRAHTHFWKMKFLTFPDFFAEKYTIYPDQYDEFDMISPDFF